MVLTSEMVAMSQTPSLLLNLVYHDNVFNPVAPTVEGQPYLNQNISCTQILRIQSLKQLGKCSSCNSNMILNNSPLTNNSFSKTILGTNNFQSKFIDINYLMMNYINNLNDDYVLTGYDCDPT